MVQRGFKGSKLPTPIQPEQVFGFYLLSFVIGFNFEKKASLLK